MLTRFLNEWLAWSCFFQALSEASTVAEAAAFWYGC